MVHKPRWFGADTEKVLSTPSRPGDDEIKSRVDQAATRAARAAELIKASGGKLRPEDAARYVRESE